MFGVGARRLLRPVAAVKLFIETVASDAVVFKASETRRFRNGIRENRMRRKIKPGVAIKFTVDRFARITGLGAPDLPAGVGVPCERRGPSGGVSWRKDSAARSWFGKEKCVRVDNEPAQICLLQEILHTGRVGAFRKPESHGLGLKKLTVDVATDPNLCPCRLFRLSQKRQDSVGRRGSDDLERAGIAQLAKGTEDVAIPFLVTAPNIQQCVVVKSRQFFQFRDRASTLHLSLGEANRPLQMAQVTVAQKVVGQHRAERRRNAKGKLKRHPIADQPLHHAEERDVSFSDGLEEPVFFEKFLVLRMPDKRQMRVKN